VFRWGRHQLRFPCPRADNKVPCNNLSLKVTTSWSNRGPPYGKFGGTLSGLLALSKLCGLEDIQDLGVFVPDNVTLLCRKIRTYIDRTNLLYFYERRLQQGRISRQLSGLVVNKAAEQMHKCELPLTYPFPTIVSQLLWGAAQPVIYTPSRWRNLPNSHRPSSEFSRCEMDTDQPLTIVTWSFNVP